MNEINNRGYKRYYGGSEWHISQDRNIILNPVFIGKTRNSEGELIPSDIYIPIIDEEQWKLAQYRNKYTYENSSKRGKRVAKYECSGLLKCSVCGHKFFFQGNNRKGSSYIHSIHCIKDINCSHPKHVPKNIKQLVMAVFMETFDRYENVDQIRESFRPSTKVKKYPKNVNKLIIELGEYKLKKDRLIEFVIDGIIQKSDVKSQMTDLN